MAHFIFLGLLRFSLLNLVLLWLKLLAARQLCLRILISTLHWLFILKCIFLLLLILRLLDFWVCILLRFSVYNDLGFFEHVWFRFWHVGHFLIEVLGLWRVLTISFLSLWLLFNFIKRRRLNRLWLSNLLDLGLFRHVNNLPRDRLLLSSNIGAIKFNFNALLSFGWHNIIYK